MKKILSIAICLTLIGGAFGQGKYTVPDITPEQKHNFTIYHFLITLGAGVSFAKTQGVTPYEYGKHIGNSFAQSWNKEIGFEGFVNHMIYNWEALKSDEDGQITIKESDDGSVTIAYPIKAWKKYLPDGNPFASFQESMESLRGVGETIADYLGCTFAKEIGQESIYFTINKK